jgi:dihydrofolate reductase
MSHFEGAAMRKLTYYVAATMDGFIATNDGHVDVFAGSGDHGAALRAIYPEAVPTKIRETLGLTGGSTFDTVLMGRKTYDFAVRTGATSPFSHLRQVVFSTTLPEAPDHSIEVVPSDPTGFERDLKGQPGKGIWLCGGGELAASIVDEIDQVYLKLFPMVLGSGRPILAGESLQKFRMVGHQVFDDGVVFIKYSRH